MKTFNTQTTSKVSFTKTKAYGLCGTVAVATALLLGAGSVSADETPETVVDTQPAVANVYTADNAGNVTVTPSETETTTVEAQPVVENTVTESPAAETTTTETVTATETPATTVTKEGDTITVTNPEVEVTFPNGTGKYDPFEVEYKNIEFPDSMAINEGDKVVTQLPDQIGLQTDFSFDVYNGDNVVGKANADAQTRVITTTFNNYFTEHPLNKVMSLKFDAKWTDIVTPGTTVSVNFDGTVKNFEIAEGTPVPTDEMISKWGWQDENDPTLINWTLRLNTARQVLNNAVLSDTWSDNQEFVEGSQNLYFVESALDWSNPDYSAKDYLESWNVRANGFDAKFKEFNRILYVSYQTRLKTAIEESTNPTNTATLTADNITTGSDSKVQLVGGRGDASGENVPEPTYEVPNEAPKVEIPEYNEPIGTVPNEAPVLDKPEWNGGVVPNEAPVYYKPELHIPEDPAKPTPNEPVKPSTPKEVPSKPVDAPKTKEVQPTTVVYKSDSVASEEVNTAVYGGQLPMTGEKEENVGILGLVLVTTSIAGLSLGFKKYNEEIN